MYDWCFGPPGSLQGFGHSGPNPRYLLTVFLLLNGLGAEHVVRWYLRRLFLTEDKDSRHVLSIFDALKTDQLFRQHKTYKRLLVSSNYAEMAKPAAGDAWMITPIPETSHDIGVMHSIANAAVMIRMRSFNIPGGIETADSLREEMRIQVETEMNYFSAPTAHSLVLGTARCSEKQMVNVYAHLKVTKSYTKEPTTERIPTQIIAGPYPAEFYTDLDTHADKPNSYHLHTTPLYEAVQSCALEHGCAYEDAEIQFKPAKVTKTISDFAFPFLNPGEWTKMVQQPDLAPTPVVPEQ